MVVVNNRLYFTNGVEIFELLLGKNYRNNPSDYKTVMIFQLDYGYVRLYNVMDSLVVRDVAAGKCYVKSLLNEFVDISQEKLKKPLRLSKQIILEQQFSIMQFNLLVYCCRGVIGFNAEYNSG